MAEVLSAVQQVLEHERQEDRLFATLCMISVAPDRSHARLHLAGHPPPLLLTPDGVRELRAPVCPPPGHRALGGLAGPARWSWGTAGPC